MMPERRRFIPYLTSKPNDGDIAPALFWETPRYVSFRSPMLLIATATSTRTPHSIHKLIQLRDLVNGRHPHDLQAPYFSLV